MSLRFPGRGEGGGLNAITEPDNCVLYSIISGD